MAEWDYTPTPGRPTPLTPSQLRALEESFVQGRKSLEAIEKMEKNDRLEPDDPQWV